MRILTVRQPWAWAIIHGGKDVENRVRNIAGDYRGPVAIHAGIAYDRGSHLESEPLRAAQDKAAVAAGAEVYPGGYTWDIGQPDPRKAWNIHGAIIGVVDLVSVHKAETCQDWGPVDAGTIDHYWCSPWADVDTHHLKLANPRPLATPIPYKGALGLRRLDKETIDTITAALAAETGEGS
ncbi:hypothetical protein AUL38_04125 [Leucobacter sp. G161]|nr:hypothetical protein AUL38_04125 [Leucobacter sp. G161]